MDSQLEGHLPGGVLGINPCSWRPEPGARPRQAPTAHGRRLTADDIHAGMPTAAFIDSIAAELRTDLAGAGFAAIRGIEQHLDAGGADEFQRATLVGIQRWMLARELWPHPEGDCRLNIFLANDGRLPVDIVGASWTFKAPHFDPHSIIFAHGYRAPENLEGGDIWFADVARYAFLNDLDVDEILCMSEHERHRDRPCIREDHVAAVLAQVGVRVSPPRSGEHLIVFVSNSITTGVAHGIEPTLVVDARRPFSRCFLRTSISPNH